MLVVEYICLSGVNELTHYIPEDIKRISDQNIYYQKKKLKEKLELNVIFDEIAINFRM